MTHFEYQREIDANPVKGNRWLRTIAFYVIGGVVFWLTLSLIFAVSSHVDNTRIGRESVFVKQVIDTAVGFGTWGILGPVLFAFSSSDRFVGASLLKKLAYSVAAAVFSFAFMITYVFLIAAPHWGYEPVAFLKVQRIVDWLGDAFLFIIVMLLGYVAATVRRAQNSALAAANLQSRLAQEQAEKSTFEATYLRGRLGSHFVMNALSNVLGLIRLDDKERAEDATILLSDILRGMTGEETKNLVSLDTEITLAEKYLAFQRIRYPSLVTSFEIEPQCLMATVPGQLLQPLLENVFKHAMLPKIATLVVTAVKQNEKLVLTIANSSVSKVADTTKIGEGLTLTRLRLKTLMGDNVKIERVYDSGCYTVRLLLPFISHEKRDVKP